MDVAAKRRFDAVKPLVGGTPLLEIAVRFRGRERERCMQKRSITT